MVVCGIGWVIALALAALALLPMTSQWEFYGQTGIGIPLPVTRRDFKGHFYSFKILIVFKFLLLLPIAVGHVFINSTATDRIRGPRVTRLLLAD